MEAVAIAQRKPSILSFKPKISWEDFQKEYLTREDEYKYE